MRKILSVIFAMLMTVPVFTRSIADVVNGKCLLENYILEYQELSAVKQVEKFKLDCKIIAHAITSYGAYYVVLKDTDIMDVDNGFVVYSIKFELKWNRKISEWIESINRIKDIFSSLSNTHFTPYDCSHLLPDGQYLDKENWIAVSKFYTLGGQESCELSTLSLQLIYIQFFVEYNNKIYKSGKSPNSDDFLRADAIENVVIRIPVDAKLENIKAKVHSVYGEIPIQFYNFAATPTGNPKMIEYDMGVITQAQYQEAEEKRLAEKEAEKRKQEEIAEQKRRAEEARIAEERRIEEARLAEEKQKKIEQQNISYASLCEEFVSSVEGKNDDLKNISLTIDGNGKHIFKVPISFLEKHGINEEIVIRNYSREIIKLSLFAQLNENIHVWDDCIIGTQSKNYWSNTNNHYGEEHVKGKYDNDMADEIEKAFGTDGKFCTKNNNIITFVFELAYYYDYFRTRGSELTINAICKAGDDICFEIGE